MLEVINGYLTNIAFRYPLIWLALPIPLFFYLLCPAFKQHTESVKVPTLHTILPDSSTNGVKPHRLFLGPYVLSSLLWICLLTTAAQPELITKGEKQEVSVRDVLLMLDVSGSMAIRDMTDGNGEETNRISVMKEAVTQFIEKREYDNIGLVVFGSQALPLTPISSDHQALLEQVKNLAPGMAGPQTSIGDALGVGVKMYRKVAKKGKKSEEKVVILLTDGLDTASTLPPAIALRLAQEQKLKIHTIAFGKAESDDEGASIDLKLLKNLAGKTSGTFHQAADGFNSLQEVYNAIDKLTPKKVEVVLTNGQSKQLFLYPLILSLLFTVVLMWLTWSMSRRKDG
ncbi:VWA domain-containing protein [Vibrio parahaemolyticus]|uniref:VWA domain-containing protein n=1 Tax=Vibrio parahaemolyticus TaxID=670 RepID=UPI003892B554